MQAFEFNSIVEEGNIRIPERYIERIVSPVRVIILSQDNTIPNGKRNFSAMSLDTKGFKFDRDDANAC